MSNEWPTVAGGAHPSPDSHYLSFGIGAAPRTQYLWSWPVPIRPATLSTPCSTPSFRSTSISSFV